MKIRPSVIIAGIIACIAIVGAAQTFLQPANPPPSVTLGWNPVPGAAGYTLYWGGASRQYTNSVTTTGTNATVTAVTRGSTYYFAVTDSSANGLESQFSSEAVYTSPAPPPAPSTAPKVIASQ